MCNYPCLIESIESIDSQSFESDFKNLFLSSVFLYFLIQFNIYRIKYEYEEMIKGNYEYM